jgi:hypothetical protein
MHPAIWVGVIGVTLTGLGMFGAGLLLLIKVVRIMTKHEDKIETVADDLKEIISAKQADHAEMLKQMRIDREATDRRLRFLEEWHMRNGFPAQPHV